jgi:hypothetical protein
MSCGLTSKIRSGQINARTERVVSPSISSFVSLAGQLAYKIYIYIRTTPPPPPFPTNQALHLSFLPFGTQAAKAFIEHRLLTRPLRSDQAGRQP